MGSVDGLIIIDIGACIGEFIDWCFAQHGDKIAQIIAFEPHPTNFNHLVGKYEKDKRVHPINYAVSNFDGKSPFYFNMRGTMTHYIGNSGSSLYNKKCDVSSEHETVGVTKLSSFVNHIAFLNKIDILKIDAECSEFDIFTDILDNKMLDMISAIYFEDHASEKNPWLRKQRAEVMQRMQDAGAYKKMWKERGTNIFANMQDILDGKTE